jgi:hypothetical protein
MAVLVPICRTVQFQIMPSIPVSINGGLARCPVRSQAGTILPQSAEQVHRGRCTG